MSFNSKNLHYDKQEPSFLRKLKGQYAGLDGRSNVQIARPKKDRLKTGDGDEDDPLIVDESGETVEKAEFERRQREGDDPELERQPNTENGDDNGQDGKQEQQHQNERQKVTEIGSSANAKKRKVGKVVTSDEVDDRGEVNVDGQSIVKKSQRSRLEDPDDAEAKSPKKKDQVKKKGKKIKLSFDDADG
ncbi:uncharacterized protein PV06_08663 [Exophiala oligosperma]|uniref:DUF4604 domain-containing protein n=2 Tax=Chaetothyriales TaxID=34395 RepID=A0A0D2D8N7_9EURO|nr:uncharacterized protein PV06_08663 [Exophiala oligosperma]KAJ9634962.1 hypothetical protein H2204_005917 [Knufia peltigerae]KIW38825.1 hypothetical protein PV06_08663 [Exophiala oligosperma]